MKNAFVTGGGRGIGAGIVEALASESWNVVFCGRKSVAEMETRREQIEREYGVRALYLQCDVSNGDDRRLAVDSALEAFGELNALVNNAGVAPLIRADILDATEESYDRVMNINLKGPYFLTQLVARHMVEHKKNDASFSAAIVNICSVSGKGLSLTAAAGEDFIVFTLTNLAPQEAQLLRDSVDGRWNDFDLLNASLIAEGLTLQPRWGTPDDVGKAVAMLLRGDLPYSTGLSIDVGGGMEIGRL